jgi:hypothetical protein
VKDFSSTIEKESGLFSTDPSWPAPVRCLPLAATKSDFSAMAEAAAMARLHRCRVLLEAPDVEGVLWLDPSPDGREQKLGVLGGEGSDVVAVDGWDEPEPAMLLACVGQTIWTVCREGTRLADRWCIRILVPFNGRLIAMAPGDDPEEMTKRYLATAADETSIVLIASGGRLVS